MEDSAQPGPNCHRGSQADAGVPASACQGEGYVRTLGSSYCSNTLWVRMGIGGGYGDETTR